MDDKKKYVNPEADIVAFANQDIIAISQEDVAGVEEGEDFQL